MLQKRLSCRSPSLFPSSHLLPSEPLRDTETQLTGSQLALTVSSVSSALPKLPYVCIIMSPSAYLEGRIMSVSREYRMEVASTRFFAPVKYHKSDMLCAYWALRSGFPWLAEWSPDMSTNGFSCSTSGREIAVA